MSSVTSYRTYWIAWGLLLALTALMLFMESVRLPAAATILVLATAMLVKATVIGGWFMHLRFERATLVIAVVGGTLLTAAVLYFLLIPDGVAMLRLAPR